MAINVEDYGALDTGPSRRRLQTEARQGRWLYELEHAMLQGAKKPAQQGGPQRAAVLPEASQAPPGEHQAAAARRRAQSDKEASDQQAVTPAQAQVASSGLPASAPVAAQEPVQQAGVIEGERTMDAGRAGAANVVRATPAAAAGTLPPDASRVAMRPGTSAVAMPLRQEQTAIPPAYLAAALSGKGGAGTATAMAAVGSTVPRVAASAAAAAAVLDMSLTSAPPASSPPEAATALAEEPPSLPGAQPELPHNEEYAQRLLHIYRDGAEVQAWVRDTALTQWQTQALAQNLARELGSTGAQLAALTVNGRRVAVGRAEKPGPEMDGYMNETAADEQESSAQPVRKINANGAM